MKPKQISTWGEIYAIMSSTGKLSPAIVQKAVSDPLTTFSVAAKACNESLAGAPLSDFTALLETIEITDETTKLTAAEQSVFWLGFYKRKGKMAPSKK